MRPDYTVAAETYDKYRSFSADILTRYIENFVDLANLRGSEKILDGGSGTGRFAVPLSERFRVTALDASREMLEKGKAKSRKVKWVQGDIARSPFKPKHFDAVLLAYMIHQVNDYHSVIEEMGRISPKCVIITTDMIHRLPTLLDRAFPGVIQADRERFPPVEELEGAFILAGFEHVRARRILIEERLSKDDYMNKITHRYLSTFNLIPQAEFDAGVRVMGKLLAGIPGDELVNRIQATFVSASNL